MARLAGDRDELRPESATFARVRFNDMEEEPLKVTLTEPELAGDYIVAERGPDGSVQLVPDTSDEAIAARLGLGGRPMTPDEFNEHFGALPRDDEG